MFAGNMFPNSDKTGNGMTGESIAQSLIKGQVAGIPNAMPFSSISGPQNSAPTDQQQFNTCIQQPFSNPFGMTGMTGMPLAGSNSEKHGENVNVNDKNTQTGTTEGCHDTLPGVLPAITAHIENAIAPGSMNAFMQTLLKEKIAANPNGVPCNNNCGPQNSAATDQQRNQQPFGSPFGMTGAPLATPDLGQYGGNAEYTVKHKQKLSGTVDGKPVSQSSEYKVKGQTNK